MKNNLIFISIPKTAYGSVRSSLDTDVNLLLGPDENSKVFEYLEDYNKIGRALHMKNNIDKSIWNNTIKFTIIRNPYDRIVSSYLEICAHYKNDFNPLILNSFYSFVKYIYDNRFQLEKIQNTKGKWHFCHQLKNITDNNGNLLVDYIIKFENLQEDYNKLRKLLNLPEKFVKHLNKRQFTHYTNNYTLEIKNMVSEIYKEDIEYFKYEYN
jgi:hypothetical protein